MESQRKEIAIEAAISKLAVRSPSPAAVILRAEGSVGAAVDDPVDRLSDDGSLGCRGAEGGNQESALSPRRSRLAHRMRDIWHVEDGNIQQPRSCFGNARLLLIDNDFARKQTPIRLGKAARRHGSIDHLVLSRAELDD